MSHFFENLYSLALDASFWLVIGLLIGGLFKTLIPNELLQRHLSGEGFVSIFKAAILGAPLPLCSCGVIPAAMGLREAGASKSATTSFLVSTPETGVDSVTITYAMMGPFMAIIRPISAVVSAIVTGSLVVLFDTNEYTSTEKVESCCSSQTNKEVVEKVETCCDSETATNNLSPKVSSCDADKSSSSCCGESVEQSSNDSIVSNVISGVKYAFTDLLDNIIFWLMIGLIFAAVVQSFVDKDLLIEYGAGWTGMLVMLVVGIPMYVCATASTPLAAGFLLAGISPGAVLVFLLAGPATNMATLGVIQQQMGKKTMFLYLLGIMVTALSSGLIINWLVGLWNIDVIQHLDANYSHTPQILQLLSLVLLLGLSLRKYIPARLIKQQL